MSLNRQAVVEATDAYDRAAQDAWRIALAMWWLHEDAQLSRAQADMEHERRVYAITEMR